MKRSSIVNQIPTAQLEKGSISNWGALLGCVCCISLWTSGEICAQNFPPVLPSGKKKGALIGLGGGLFFSSIWHDEYYQAIGYVECRTAITSPTWATRKVMASGGLVSDEIVIGVAHWAVGFGGEVIEVGIRGSSGDFDQASWRSYILYTPPCTWVMYPLFFW